MHLLVSFCVLLFCTANAIITNGGTNGFKYTPGNPCSVADCGATPSTTDVTHPSQMPRSIEHQFGFDENQCVTLSQNYSTRNGVLLAGTVVSSHFIYWNTISDPSQQNTISTWTFDADVIGIMSDASGNHIIASTSQLGLLPLVDYLDAAVTNYGVEGGSVTWSGRHLTYSSFTDTFIDAMRVITKCNQCTNKADGTLCNDGNPCTKNDECQCGYCVGFEAEQANGDSCDDGNACTLTDTCQSGVCRGSNPKSCEPLDQCHDAGTCDPATGICSDPAREAGSPCSDGRACTKGDACNNNGQCISGGSDCPACGQCKVQGVCQQNGLCTVVNADDGTNCNDNNPCTQTDTCMDGECRGGNVISCTASDQCHEAGTCNPVTGTCSDPVSPNGKACTDGDACTRTDQCDNGQCKGGNNVTCTACDQCHVPGTCNPTTGECSVVNAADGTGCDDGNACTLTDTCQAGVCKGSNPKVCVGDQCREGGTCNPENGVCSVGPAKASGTECSDGNPCTAKDTCNGSGSCQSGPNRCNCKFGNPVKCGVCKTKIPDLGDVAQLLGFPPNNSCNNNIVFQTSGCGLLGLGLLGDCCALADQTGATC